MCIAAARNILDRIKKQDKLIVPGIYLSRCSPLAELVYDNVDRGSASLHHGDLEGFTSIVYSHHRSCLDTRLQEPQQTYTKPDSKMEPALHLGHREGSESSEEVQKLVCCVENSKALQELQRRAVLQFQDQDDPSLYDRQFGTQSSPAC